MLVHLLEPSPCPGRLAAQKGHELTGLRWQDEQDAEKEEGEEDFAVVGCDLRTVADERHRDEDKVHHLKVGGVLSDEIWEGVEILQVGAHSAREHNDGHHDVDNIEDVTRGVNHHVVDDALREVDAAQIKHNAGAEEAIGVLGPAEDPHQQEWQSGKDLHHRAD